ncbi:Fic/DOC family protein [Selenomonas sp. FOBRC6]|nr:Fic/DOC family protein [Selenomonas sp. FOBRC6]
MTRHLNFILQEYGQSQTYPAFYCYTEELALLQEAIGRDFTALLGHIAHVPTAGIDQFLHTCLVQEILATNAIEGVHSTKREIRAAMETAPADRLRMRLGGVVNKYTRILQGEEVPLETPADLRALFDAFIADEIRRANPSNLPNGHLFRRDSVDIVSPTQKTIHRGSYPEEKIVRDLEQALALLHAEQIPLLYRIAIFHYLFGYIHPFCDGNGRMSRFITTYLLAREFHPTVALQLSLLIKKRRKSYYKLFAETTSSLNCGDMTPFIIGTLRFVHEAIDYTAAALEERLQRYRKYLDIVLKDVHDKTMRGVYDVLLQAAVFSDVGATVSEIAGTLDKTETTIYAKLKQIPEVYINQNRTSRPYHYMLRTEAFD